MPATFTEHEIKAKLTDKRKLSAYLDKLVDTHLEGIKKVRLKSQYFNDLATMAAIGPVRRHT